jgi:flavin reductase (DIM6/NTAB) family NADH-FMN oxidoreductase RutF
VNRDRGDDYQDVVGSLRVPMFVVTTAADGERAGCLVEFASQSSIDPPRFTVWISDVNRTAEVAARASTLAVHVLRTDDDELASLFGEETGDRVDKFASVAWRDGPDGVPVLERCDWFAGRIVGRVDGLGDHRGYVLEPLAAERRHAGLGVLTSDRVRGLQPGHVA